MNIIDTHHHLWDFARYDYGWIEKGVGTLGKNFLPPDLEATVTPCGVVGTVLVQTIHSFDETRWFCSLANENELIKGVVGWVDLTASDLTDRLDQLTDDTDKLVGIRHVTHDEPDDNWLLRPDVLSGLDTLQARRIPFDLLLRPRHLKHVPALAARFPDLPMVIDHIAKPLIKDQITDGWQQDIARAAEFPNIYCKLSGMITEADHQNWQPQDLKPYIDHCIDVFGFDRLMYGSDWPVCLLAGTYARMLDALQTCIASHSDAEKKKLLAETAVRYYGLAV